MVKWSVAVCQEQLPRTDDPYHQWAFPDGTLWTQFYRDDQGYLLRFPLLADFSVSADGDRVVCSPALGVTDTTPQHLYLNQVLPLVLSKLGKLVFHGSAVEIDGGTVAFMAESGRGKSTLAASFAVNGCRFLTDDGLVVEDVEGRYLAMPSHPSIRLWEDSEEALVPSGSIAEPALHFTSKLRFMAGDTIPFCDQPRPLRRGYFLGDGSATYIVFQRLSESEALLELIKHSFLLDIEDRDLLAYHFDRVARLAQERIYYRLDYPRRYEDLPRVREAITRHAMEQESKPI